MVGCNVLYQLMLFSITLGKNNIKKAPTKSTIERISQCERFKNVTDEGAMKMISTIEKLGNILVERYQGDFPDKIQEKTD
jgi:hypothetical protein